MQEKNIHKIFAVSLILKGLNAFLEIVSGVLFLFTGSLTLLTQFLIRGELIEDPKDVIANIVQHYIPYLSAHTQLFFAFYLLSHGIIKIFLVVGLLRNKLWAYPSAIVVFSLFIVYQIYRFTITYSVFLVLLTLFDLLVIWLTWHEYKIIKQHKIINP